MRAALRKGLARVGRPLPIHPFLFAAYPILFLYSINFDEVYAADAVQPLLMSIAGTAAALIVVRLLFDDLRHAAMVVSALVIAFFGYGRLEEMTAGLGTGRVVPILVLAALVLLAVEAGVHLRGRLRDLTFALNGLSGVLVALTLFTIVPHEVSALTPARVSAQAVGSGGSVPTDVPARDIYYLVFDRYGSQSSIQLEFGVDNSEFLDWLRAKGFYVADHSHANYVRTTLSLAGVLNLMHLDDVAARLGYDNSDQKPLLDMMNDHQVGRFLKSQGYQYIHVGGWWDDSRVSPIADINTSKDTLTDFSAALFDSTILPVFTQRRPDRPVLEEVLAATPGGGYIEYARRAYDGTVGQFRSLHEASRRPGRKFVYAHVLAPHPPYVFDQHGNFLVHPYGVRGREYGEQLTYVNGEIQALVESLLDVPEDRRPIIILQADEGPYPLRYEGEKPWLGIHFDWNTATQKELEVKFGILNAWYAPEVPREQLYPTMTSVNTFRIILSRYFGVDLPPLPDIVRASSSGTPYDFFDVTDRLPLP